jgi:hypothetical protein
MKVMQLKQMQKEEKANNNLNSKDIHYYPIDDCVV